MANRSLALITWAAQERDAALTGWAEDRITNDEIEARIVSLSYIVFSELYCAVNRRREQRWSRPT